jgi:Nif-specific regulatory protein
MALDRSFLEKVSSVIADSAKLRERIAEEQFRFFKARPEEAPCGRARVLSYLRAFTVR